MEAVIEYCNRLEALWRDWKILDFSLAEALSAAATVRYGRCFKSGVRDRLPTRRRPTRVRAPRFIIHHRRRARLGAGVG